MTQKKNYSVQDLLDRAHGFLDRFPPEPAMAERFYEKALSREPENTDVLDAFGDFLCSIGDCERASELLRKSVSLRPDGAGQKYFNLGQMAEGKEALALYEKGISLLAAEFVKGEVSQSRGMPPRWQMKRQLVSGYCSVAELYMTDLCDEAEAETACDAALRSALAADGKSFEALAAWALLKKTQGNLEGAREAANRALLSLRAMDPGGTDDDAMEQDVKEDPNEELMPTSESRIGLCRTMIDLEMTTEARELLSRLLEEDDEEPQVWYLLACAHGVERDFEAVAECVERFEAILIVAPELKAQWEAPLGELRLKFLQADDGVPAHPAPSPALVEAEKVAAEEDDAMDVREMD